MARRFTVYRMSQAGTDPLSVAGSRAAGGRYNPAGGFGVLYTSFDAATAAREIARGLRRRGIDTWGMREGAWWLHELEVRVTRLADLTGARTLARFHTTRGELIAEDWTAARRVASQVMSEGIEALIAPSAADPGRRNLIVFPDLLLEPPRVMASRPALFPAPTPIS